MGKWITIAIQTYLGTFRHNLAYTKIIQAYSVVIRTLRNLAFFIKLLMLLLVLIVSCVFRTLVYPESWHIQNQNHIQNPGIFTILVYPEPWYPGMFRTLAYSRPGAYPEHCQTSAMKRFVKVVNGYNYLRKSKNFQKYVWMISFLEPATLLKMTFFWGIFQRFCLKVSEDIFCRTPGKKIACARSFKIIQNYVNIKINN